MKKIYCLLVAALTITSIWAQSPQKMSYQAVIRDAGNLLVTNQSIGMRVSILQGSVNGSAVYIERQTPMTNTNGLASMEIGAGNVVSGTFSGINWGDGPYFIKTETDPAGGTNYTISGTSQLLSVPYALHARNTDSWQVDGNTTYTLKNQALIRPAFGDAVLSIEADPTDTDEEDTPMIEFVQDGGYPVSAIGMNLLENGIENALYIANNTSARGGIFFMTDTNPTGTEGWQGLEEEHIRMTITNDGKIGVNTTTPQRSLHVNDVMRLQPRATPPTAPQKGDMYFDGTLNKLRVFDGTVWQNCW